MITMMRFPLSLHVRATPSRAMSVLSPFLALLCTLVIGIFLFAILGKDPAEALRIFLIEPFRDARALAELGLKTIPLVLCALGLSLCYRANVWNIGAEGQLVLGGICAAATVLWFDLVGNSAPVPLVLILSLLMGILGGMFWAGITALCKDRFNANEILVSLMLVYIAQLLLMFICSGPLKDPNGMNFPQSKAFSVEFLMPLLFVGGRLHAGFIVMLVLVAVMTVLLFRSFTGFRLMVGGAAPAAALYAGFSARRALWTVLLTSGGFAGLAGAFEVMGPIGQLLPSISPGYGFAAIIVAFIGRLHPVGALLGGLVMSVFYLGGELAQSRLGLPAAITGVFQSLLLFFLLSCDTLIAYQIRWRR